MRKYTREWNGQTITTIWKGPNEIRINDNDPITQALGICFTNEGNILLIRKPEGRWHLPGGHPEKGEDLTQTVLREVTEEANVNLSKTQLLGFSEIFFPGNTDELEGEHYYQSRFACLISEINESKEDPATGITFERKFVTPIEFVEFIKWDDAKDLLDLALEELNKFNN